MPRYISPTNVVVAYDPTLSEARLLLNSLAEQKYANETVLMFDLLPQGGSTSPLLLITDKRIFVLKDKQSVLLNVQHTAIQSAQLFESRGHKYVVELAFGRGSEKKKFGSVSYPIITRCCSYLPMVPAKAPAPNNKK